MSKTIEDALMSCEDEQTEVEFLNIKVRDIELIVEYCTHHKFEKKEAGIEKPLKSKDPNVFIPDEWDRDFVQKLSIEEKVRLLIAVNELNVPALYDLLCASVCVFFKGKDIKSLKAELGMEHVEYTPEREEELKKEYPWVVEAAEKKIAEVQKVLEAKANN